MYIYIYFIKAKILLVVDYYATCSFFVIQFILWVFFKKKYLKWFFVHFNNIKPNQINISYISVDKRLLTNFGLFFVVVVIFMI